MVYKICLYCGLSSKNTDLSVPIVSVMLFDGIQQFDIHRDKLIETITNKYMQIRLFRETRKINNAIKIRKKLRKIPHFRNE